MGDRANVVIKDGNEQICLYTHWNGYHLPKTLQDALKRGKSRLEDSQYIARVIFNEMTKGNEMDLTGYGISQTPHDNECNRPIIEFDVGEQNIKIGNKSFTVDEYLLFDINDETLNF